MTSIERTVYPRFTKLTSARMLPASFTPQSDEIEWARGHTNSPQALLTVLLALKCHQKMARFPAAGEVPEEVVDHVRRRLDLEDDVEPDHGAGRTAPWHRRQIRARLGVTYAPVRARQVTAEAIEEAARSRNNPPDLINVALDETDVVRTLVVEGWTITAEDLAGLSPYLRAHIRRFGAYATDELGIEPEAFEAALAEIDFSVLDLAA